MTSHLDFVPGKPVEFVVIGPPIPWQRAEGNGKRRYTSREQREYQAHVAFCASVARPSTWPTDREYEISLHVVHQDRRRRDLSNVLKTIEDACIDVLWDDDSQIARIGRITREYDKRRPRVEVRVEVIA